MLQGKLKMTAQGETLIFKIAKVLGGAPWQKVNLEYLLIHEFK